MLPKISVATGKNLGMIMFNDALIEHVKNGLVEPRDAYIKAVDKAGSKPCKLAAVLSYSSLLNRPSTRPAVPDRAAAALCTATYKLLDFALLYSDIRFVRFNTRGEKIDV